MNCEEIKAKMNFTDELDWEDFQNQTNNLAVCLNCDRTPYGGTVCCDKPEVVTYESLLKQEVSV